MLSRPRHCNSHSGRPGYLGMAPLVPGAISSSPGPCAMMLLVSRGLQDRPSGPWNRSRKGSSAVWKESVLPYRPRSPQSLDRKWAAGSRSACKRAKIPRAKASPRKTHHPKPRARAQPLSNPPRLRDPGGTRPSYSFPRFRIRCFPPC